VFSVNRLVSRRCHRIGSIAGHSMPCSTMRALTPGHRHLDVQVSPLQLPYLPTVPPPTTACAPTIALTTTSAWPVCFRLRHLVEGSPSHAAESSSLSCRPIFHLQLLPTPSHDDAVPFGYGAVVFSDTDLHRADKAPSWAHD